MKQHVIGFDFTEVETTTEDYLSLKIIYQGVLRSKQVIIPRIEAFNYEASIETFDLIQGYYNRILIGVTQNAEVIINESRVEFKANPNTSLRIKSYYETVLENIEGYLMDKDSVRHSEYEIDGRQIKRIPFNQLISLREKFKKLVNSENRGIDTSAPDRSIIYQW